MWRRLLSRLRAPGSVRYGAILIPHGMQMGTADGALYAVVAPRWWQFWVWVAWRRSGAATALWGARRVRVVFLRGPRG